MLFVHSFMTTPENNHAVIAAIDFKGLYISIMLNTDNIYGSHFHPEKSGTVVLQIILNFLEVKTLCLKYLP